MAIILQMSFSIKCSSNEIFVFWFNCDLQCKEPSHQLDVSSRRPSVKLLDLTCYHRTRSFVKLVLSSIIFYRVAPDFASGCSRDVWCHGLTNRLPCAIHLFWKSGFSQKRSCTFVIPETSFYCFCTVYTFSFTYIVILRNISVPSFSFASVSRIQ